MTDPKLRPGTNRCLCGACGEYFSNVTNFDMHRKWRETDRTAHRTRECAYPGTITTKDGKARLRRNADGIWTRADGAYIPR